MIRKILYQKHPTPDEGIEATEGGGAGAEDRLVEEECKEGREDRVAR